MKRTTSTSFVSVNKILWSESHVRVRSNNDGLGAVLGRGVLYCEPQRPKVLPARNAGEAAAGYETAAEVRESLRALCA